LIKTNTLPLPQTATAKAQLKKDVSKAVLKVSKLTESRTAAGMLFQTSGAEAVKECW